MRAHRAILVAASAASLLLAGCPQNSEVGGQARRSSGFEAPEPNVPAAERVPLDRARAGQLVYVPVYSHVYHAGGRRYLLEATLSVRNTDPSASITINRVDYYDSAGELVGRKLEAPLRLEPLASTEFLVTSRDTSGGAGANFLVEWVADKKVNEPLIECLMAGMSGTHGLSYARAGRVIDDRNR